MKTSILAAAATILSATGVVAESAGRQFAAGIPFAFHANGRLMKAGSYDFRLGMTGRDLRITARKAGGDVVTAVTYRDLAVTPSKTEFKFNCFAELCFLREVIEPRTRVALVLPADKLEKEWVRAFKPKSVIAASD